MLPFWLMGGWLREQAGRLREAVTLEDAERRARQRSTEQQARLSRLFEAAQRRLGGARALRDERQAASALVLYREALALLVTAGQVAEDPSAPDGARDGAACWTSLERQLEREAVDRPVVARESVREWLASADTLDVDRAASADPQRVRQDAEALACWLEARIDPRGKHEIRVQRGLRIGGLAVGLLVLLFAAVAAAFAPNNVARGRPVTVSSRQPGSPAPSQVVNGTIERSYGLLTKRESEPWVQVDLGASYALSEVVVYNRGDQRGRGPELLLLELATENGDYRDAGRHEGRLGANQAWRVKLDQAVARFIRIASPHPAQLGLAEIEAYGARP